jgi:hypothetical protein
MTTEPLLEPTSNGQPIASARERIAHDLEAEIATLTSRRDELQTELTAIGSDLKTFEQALLRLRGEPLIVRTKSSATPKRDKPSKGVSAEQLAALRAAVLRFARDHDEFRQIDIRTMPDAPTNQSSTTALGFEQLRQDGVIRFARKDGNSKYFRLTAEALRELDA